MNAREGRLHVALSEIGSELPEPTAPSRVRDLIEQMPCATETPLVRSMPWRRAGVGVLGTLAATFAIAAGVLYVQNHRLTLQLRQVQTESGPQLQTVSDKPPLVALNFYNEKCPVACAVMPRFEELLKAHAADDVLFVTIDVSESKQAQGMKLTEALECDFVYACADTEITTGTVMLVDMRTQEVIKAFRGAEQIDAVEKALGEALITCCPDAGSHEGSDG